MGRESEVIRAISLRIVDGARIRGDSGHFVEDSRWGENPR